MLEALANILENWRYFFSDIAGASPPPMCVQYKDLASLAFCQYNYF